MKASPPTARRQKARIHSTKRSLSRTLRVVGPMGPTSASVNATTATTWSGGAGTAVCCGAARPTTVLAGCWATPHPLPLGPARAPPAPVALPGSVDAWL